MNDFAKEFPRLSSCALTNVRPNKKMYFCEDDVRDCCLDRIRVREVLRQEGITERDHPNIYLALGLNEV